MTLTFSLTLMTALLGPDWTAAQGRGPVQRASTRHRTRRRAQGREHRPLQRAATLHRLGVGPRHRLRRAGRKPPGHGLWRSRLGPNEWRRGHADHGSRPPCRRPLRTHHRLHAVGHSSAPYERSPVARSRGFFLFGYVSRTIATSLALAGRGRSRLIAQARCATPCSTGRRRRTAHACSHRTRRRQDARAPCRLSGSLWRSPRADPQDDRR